MEEELKIKKHNLKLITLVCLLSSILIDIIYNTTINIYVKSFIVPLGIMLTGYIFLIYENKLIYNKKSYILLIPILLILLSNVIIDVDFSNEFLNLIMLPVLMSVFFFYLTNKNYTIGNNTVRWAFKLFPKGLFSNLRYLREIFKKKKSSNFLNIILGLLIGIPVGLLILSLLASADKYFGIFIDNILDIIPSISFNQISDIFILLISFIILFSIFINILRNTNTKLERIDHKKEINITVSSIVLIIINLVFATFLISEVSKLTTNFLHLPVEYTYAEYAREGFFQLLVVTTINFIIIIYHLYRTKGIKDKNYIKKLLLVLISFSILLILNSYYRMFLYVGAYGFTILRLQVLLFLTMELKLFSILITKITGIFKIKENILYSVILISFYILNIYLCTNDFIELLNKYCK